jgi:nicotinamide-nucleotide amidase
MAEGVRRALGADIGLSTTGIAGPTGGTVEKPVGLVFIAIADASGTFARELRTGGAREYIKTVSAQAALDLLRRRLIGAV